jgi:XFP C-terminal domain
VIFAFHDYPRLIHRLTYRQSNHDNFHVHGYKEEGTTNTPFDMVLLNELDRFHLVGDVIDRVPGLAARMAYLKQSLRDRLIEDKEYITKHGHRSTARVARVLLVESGAISGPMLGRWLQQRGHTLDVASGAKSGFDRAVADHPNVVLIDLGWKQEAVSNWRIGYAPIQPRRPCLWLL